MTIAPRARSPKVGIFPPPSMASGPGSACARLGTAPRQPGDAGHLRAHQLRHLDRDPVRRRDGDQAAVHFPLAGSRPCSSMQPPTLGRTPRAFFSRHLIGCWPDATSWWSSGLTTTAPIWRTSPGTGGRRDHVFVPHTVGHGSGSAFPVCASRSHNLIVSLGLLRSWAAHGLDAGGHCCSSFRASSLTGWQACRIGMGAATATGIARRCLIRSPGRPRSRATLLNFGGQTAQQRRHSTTPAALEQPSAPRRFPCSMRHRLGQTLGGPGNISKASPLLDRGALPSATTARG